MMAAPFVWAAFLLVLHLMPVHLSDDSSFRFPHSDKVVHYCMFVGLCALIVRFYQTRSHQFVLPLKTTLIAIIIAASYGVLMELAQKWAPEQREADLFDWFADVLGACTGALVALKIRGRWIARLTKDSVLFK